MKYILVFSLFINLLFSCTMCQFSIPTANVQITIDAEEKEVTLFHIQWYFDKGFVDTIKIYDKNKNNKFDKAEKKEILEAIVVYAKDYNYLTSVKFLKEEENQEEVEEETILPFSKTIDFLENGKMVYSYKFEVLKNLKKFESLSIEFLDGSSFYFNVENVIFKNYKGYKEIITMDANTKIYFQDISQKNVDINETTLQPQEVVTKKENPTSFLQNKLKDVKNEVIKLLEDIKQNNSISSYFWLFIFSFAYGLIHALGPGHGKSLVSAYFLANNKSYVKAFSIASIVGVVHTFSAFFLTVLSYFVLNKIFASFFIDVENIAIKISSVIIIFIALYMLFKKLSKKHESSCGCSSCKTNSTDLGVILGAGIVPCPGTVAIFIFTFSMGIYVVGVVSAIFMSFGMSLVIFLAAILSIKIKKTSLINEKVIILFEYLSLLFILGLGIFLLM